MSHVEVDFSSVKRVVVALASVAFGGWMIYGAGPDHARLYIGVGFIAFGGWLLQKDDVKEFARFAGAVVRRAPMRASTGTTIVDTEKPKDGD
jgi:putative Ca2+/H+ antiporter (TMEM165/GDT1 family)